MDDEVVTAEGLVKWLKLRGSFDSLIEELVSERLTVHAARRSGIEISIEAIQERFDQIRRVEGLHRAKDAQAFLEQLGVTLDDFEAYITDTLYKERMLEHVHRREALDEYFHLNSPKFEVIEISHIVVDAENKAREILSLAEEEPEMFPDLAREHSLDEETCEQGGRVGRVMRGELQHQIEAKIFNAEVGELLGPFQTPDELFYEIFKVDARHSARLDGETLREVRRLVYQDWLQARAQEHRLEVL
ncbi:MAG: peptidylprolyl isomerase [Ectothiorhodospiraceae bacterium]|nr:peptidylprolyl isomerase [Ectothiorhodospiraceae bacterium]